MSFDGDHNRALYNRLSQGETIEEGPVPEELKELVAEKRQLFD